MSRKSLTPLNALSSASAPTVPTLQSGDLYYDTSTGLRVYDGSAWVAANAIPASGGLFYIWGERNSSPATGNFFAFGNGANNSAIGVNLTQSGTLDSLAIQAGTAFTGTFTVEVYKNATATGKTLSVSSGNTEGYVTGLNLSVVAGDSISWIVVAGGVGGTSVVVSSGIVTSSVVVTGATGATGPAGNNLVGFNTQTGTSYTLVAGDKDKIVTANNAAAITITVPPSVFTANEIVNVAQYGAGQVTFAQGAGVTIRSAGAISTAPKLRQINSASSVICTASNTFLIVGDIL
jgi:hypothetical protein